MADPTRTEDASDSVARFIFFATVLGAFAFVGAVLVFVL